MLTIDDRCSHRDCTQKGIYRMVGSCLNCGTDNILLLITEGHEKPTRAECPTCGCRDVSPMRLATEDEIPSA